MGRAGQRRSLDKLILDLDNSASETYGCRQRASSLSAMAVWHGPRPRGHDRLRCVKHAHASVEHATRRDKMGSFGKSLCFGGLMLGRSAAAKLADGAMKLAIEHGLVANQLEYRIVRGKGAGQASA